MTVKKLHGKTLTVRPGRTLGGSAPRPVKCEPTAECSDTAECVPDMAIYWRDRETGLVDQTAIVGTLAETTLVPYTPNDWVFQAEVVGETCGCADITWEHTNWEDWIGLQLPVMTPGVRSYAIGGWADGRALGAGVIELTATVCGTVLGPITLTLVEDIPYGS